MPLLNQDLDQPDDIRDVLCGLGFDVGRSNSEEFHVLLVSEKIFLCNFCRCFPFFRGSFDDLVVHVREVSHVRDVIPVEPKIVPDDVEDERAPGMTKVRIVVHRDAASIHADGLRLQRLKDLLLTGQRVVDFQHDGGPDSASAWRRRGQCDQRK